MSDDARVPDDLRGHEPSGGARRRAEQAGLDLERLRREAPDHYRMLNAEELVRVSPELAEAAGQLAFEAFPDRSVYRVPSRPAERLLAFPPLSTEELARFDEAAAQLVAGAPYAEAHAFYRTIDDLRGTHRELMLPTPPDAWAGEPGLVGPFESQEAAEAWPAGRLPRELMADPVPYQGRWYCDVFRSDDDLLFPQEAPS